MNLSPSQNEAYEKIMDFLEDKSRNEFILSGSPGTGKSFLIDAISKKKNVILTATTNKAAEVIDGDTIHSLLRLKLMNDYKTGESYLDASKARQIVNEIVIIDECSMIDEELYNIIKCFLIKCKIIYVGDYYQLPPVKCNFSIFNLGIEMTELKEIMRTDKDDIKNLITNLKKCVENHTVYTGFKPSENIEIFESKKPECAQAMLSRISEFVYPNDRILAYTNECVVGLNNFVRKHIFKKEPDFEKNDIVVFKTSTLDITKDKFSRTKIEHLARITSIENNGQTYTVEFDSGSVYKAIKDRDFFNDNLKVLAEKAKKTKNWKSYFDFKDSMLDMRFTYASTVHSSQGSTYNNVFIDFKDIVQFDDPKLVSRLLYVACSRAKEKIIIYV